MYFRSRERKFHRWNFRSVELSFHGTFIPSSENDVELSFLESFDPMSQSNMKLSLPTRIITDLYRLWEGLRQSSSKWLLKFNIIKCGVMTVGRGASPMCYRYVVIDSTEIQVLTSCDPFYQPAPSVGALMIPAALIPAHDCFTRPHRMCKPTSYNRSCTGNDILWSLLTMCAVNYWRQQLQDKGSESFTWLSLSGVKVPGNESSTSGTFAPWSKSTWKRKFQLLFSVSYYYSL